MVIFFEMVDVFFKMVGRLVWMLGLIFEEFFFGDFKIDMGEMKWERYRVVVEGYVILIFSICI